jgi:hypothetical protein
MTVVRVTRQRIASRGHGFAWYWHYYVTGPDGTRFDNRSIVTLRERLRHRYGRDVQIIESWKTTTEGRTA